MLVLEADLHGRLAEEKRIIARLGLHWNETRLAVVAAGTPGLVSLIAKIRQGQPRTSGYYLTTLHCLAVYGSGWEVKTNLGALLSVSGFYQDTVTNNYKAFAVPHPCNLAGMWVRQEVCSFVGFDARPAVVSGTGVGTGVGCEAGCGLASKRLSDSAPVQ